MDLRAARTPLFAACLLAGTAGAQRDLAQWPSDPIAAAAALPITESVAGGTLVTVVDPEGQPIAGADVYVVSADCVDIPTRSFLGFHFGDSWQYVGGYHGLLAGRRGTRFRTDADGTVRIAVPEHALGLTVANGLAAQSWSPTRGGRVRLEPFAVVRVEVVDAVGRPAAQVPVTLGDGRGLRFPGVTDATGRATLRIWRRSLTGDGVRRVVQAGVVAMTPPHVRLPDDYFAPGLPALLRLQLPPTGSVRLRITDGEPLWVGLGVAEPPTSFGLESPFCAASRWIDGEALFPFVGLDQSVRAKVTLADADNESIEVAGAGPTTAGEEVALAESIAARTLEISGRLFGDNGEPVADTQISVWIRSGGHGNLDQPRTDAAGRFRYRMSDEKIDGDTVRLEFHGSGLWHDDRRDGAKRPVAVVVLPGKQRGSVDLGDLRLALQPVVIAGRVVDTAGLPVAGAEVGVPLTMMARFESPSNWAITDENGRFELREAEAEAVDLVFSLRAADYVLVTPTKVKPGELDLTVRVRRLAEITLTLADPAGSTALTVQVATAGDAAGRSGQTVRVDGGRAKMDHLQPGKYDVRLLLGGLEVTRIDGVEARVGGLAPDPRLVDVAWRDRVALTKVKVLDPDGAPLRVRFYFGDTGNGLMVVTLESNARGEAVLPHLPGQVVVATHPKYRHAAVPTDQQGDVEMRLAPRARLRLRLPEGLSLPSGVRVLCDHQWSDQHVPNSGANWRGGDEVEIAPAGSGEVTLRLVLYGPKRWTLLEQFVELPADDTLTDVRLELEAAIAARAAEIVEEQVRRRGK